MTYKGISRKKDKAIIILTETFTEGDRYWNVKETYIRGNLSDNFKGDLKNPFELEESKMTNIRKSDSHSVIDLDNMTAIYNKSVDYYDFGNMEYVFDIRNKVDYTNSSGAMALFSLYGATQIARSFPFDLTNRMNVVFPASSPDSKLRAYVKNNGIKKIKINSKEIKAYEIEIKIEGIPFSIFLPDINAYIEAGDDNRKILKYDSITGTLDGMELYLTEYKTNWSEK